MRPDIFFVTSYEPDAEANWARLRGVAPRARRITGRRSIPDAYAACAEASRASHFFMVDGDNWLLDGFSFDLDFAPNPQKTVVWRACNPVNGLVYDHGAVKLLPTSVALGALTGDRADVATSLAPGYRIVDVVASEHRFNADACGAWRTTFRGCVKLAVYLVSVRTNEQDDAQLAVCCDKVGPGAADHADACVAGAREGRAYGRCHIDDPASLAQINDFGWLQQRWTLRRSRDN